MFWLEKRAWRWLLCRATKRATKAYAGPGQGGAYFNTANFDQALGKLTGVRFSNARLEMLLVNSGWEKLPGGCHWGKPYNNV